MSHRVQMKFTRSQAEAVSAALLGLEREGRSSEEIRSARRKVDHALARREPDEGHRLCAACDGSTHRHCLCEHGEASL